ncbi:nitroreductase [Chloroflexota bacterium]
MDIAEAIGQRKSIRAFKSDPVPREILESILEMAVRAPSWANTQPWEFAIVSGTQLEEIRQGFIEKAKEEPTSDIARPKEFPEPFNSRLRAVGAKLLEIRGIQREDKERREWWRQQVLRHYGAPSVIYILIDRDFYFQGDDINVWPVFDCALVAENIMLLAIKYGLGTIALAQAVTHSGIVREVLGISDSKLMVLGIAIGYPDWDDAINQLHSDREPLESIAKWYGFD